MERLTRGEWHYSPAGTGTGCQFPFPSAPNLTVPSVPEDVLSRHTLVMRRLMASPRWFNLNRKKKTMTLYRKKGKRYLPVSPEETIQAGLTQLREAGHADLAAAIELKITAALFSRTAEEVLEEEP